MEAKTIILSIESMTLLQITRGYKTMSSDTIITSIYPNTFILLYKIQKNNILQLHNNSVTQIHLPHLTVQQNILGWKIHEADKTSHTQVNTIGGSTLLPNV